MPGEPDVIREPGTRRIQYHAGMISHPQSGYADHQRMVGWFVLTAQVGSGMPLTGRVVHYATNDVDPFEKTRAVVEASWEGGPTAAEVADSGLLRCQMMYEPVSGTIDWDAPDEVIIDTLYGRLVLRSSAEHSAE
jgi:hypothetical protein